jgi:hypothetical protein
LWSSAEGEIVSITDGLHRIKIQNKAGDGFWHTDASGDFLETDL